MTRIEAHHEPSKGAAGHEASDALVCPLCVEHHAYRTKFGLMQFIEEFGVDLRISVINTLERRLEYLEQEADQRETVTAQDRSKRKSRIPFTKRFIPLSERKYDDE